MSTPSPSLLLVALTILLFTHPCRTAARERTQPAPDAATLLSARQKSTDALAMLEELHEADPTDQRVAQSLARARSHSRDLEGALALYDRLINDGVSDPAVRIERARVLAWMGETEESRRSMIELTNENPTEVEAWAVLADGRLWSGDRKGAREDLARGLTVSPQSPVLLSRLARLEYLEDRVGNARSLLLRARPHGEERPEIAKRLALYSRWITQASFSHEETGDARSMRTIAMEAGWRPEGPWSGTASLEQVVRLGREEYSTQLHFRRTVREGLILGAGARVAPGAELLPRVGGLLDVGWSPVADWTVDWGVRFSSFATGEATILRVGATRWLGAGVSTGYHVDWARDIAKNRDWAHALRLQWASSPWTRTWIDLFHGTDVEKIGRTADATTITTDGINVSTRFYASRRWGVNLQAGYADQKGSGSRRSIGLGILRHL